MKSPGSLATERDVTSTASIGARSNRAIKARVAITIRRRPLAAVRMDKSLSFAGASDRDYDAVSPSGARMPAAPGNDISPVVAPSGGGCLQVSRHVGRRGHRV